MVWTSYQGPITTSGAITIADGSSGSSSTLYAVRVDGVVMRDSTTQNLDFGTTGFYLPMDDQDDFEKDKSGKGNNFTKQNMASATFPHVVKDSPSGAVFGDPPTSGITTTSSAPSNYCTLNPGNNINCTLTKGNLKFVTLVITPLFGLPCQYLHQVSIALRALLWWRYNGTYVRSRSKKSE